MTTDTKGYKCFYCENVYQIKWYWQQHMIKKHEEHRPHSCLICHERFKFQKEYKVHRQSHRQCPICQKQLKSFFSLACHIRKHSEDAKFTCDICRKSYVFENNLKWHKIHVHETVHVCEVCGKSIKSKGAFECHMITHEKDYNEKLDSKCEFCLRVFRQKRHLHRHIQRNHKDRQTYVCDLCGKTFLTKRGIKDHKNVHKGIKMYECKFCGRQFTRHNTLVDHLRTHTGEQPFKCTHCDKAFSQRTALRIHVRLHTGERPYSCDICQNKFVCKGALSIHMKNKHKVE